MANPSSDPDMEMEVVIRSCPGSLAYDNPAFVPHDEVITCRNRDSSVDSADHDRVSRNGFDQDGRISIISPASMYDVPEAKPAVLVVRDGMKAYNPLVPVLKDFNMTVDEGSIYTLLGSSGCGKTTILSCVVALQKLDSGSIYVFGKHPGEAGSGIPGKNVGYMPQDLSLNGDFTIGETLWFYGTLYCMPRDVIEKNKTFLLELLSLPDANTMVGPLSAGTKRRVSIAVSMIHDPPFLILDEPTVGVDPILRESIWAHLVDQVSKHNKTIIITTHYIEEARQSNKVGLMRGGQLLTEKPPDVLMREHNAKMLEEVVIKLCRNDDMGASDTSRSAYAAANSSNRLPVMAKTKETTGNTSFQDAMQRIAALSYKNAMILIRNYLLLIFILWVPAGQVIFSNLCLGGDPEDIKWGIVNHEFAATNTSNCKELLELRRQPTNNQSDSCNLIGFSCEFLAVVDEDQVDQEFYDTEYDAIEAVKDGDAWGYLSIPPNFSKAYFALASYQRIEEAEIFDNATITFQMDETVKAITEGMQTAFRTAHRIFTQNMLAECGLWVGLADNGMELDKPIYGEEDWDATDFISPGILTIILWFFPIMSSSVQYIYERKIGTLERAKVAGINTWENMMAFSLVTFVTLAIQSTLAIFIMAVVFEHDIEGSWALCGILALLCGLLGVSMGFVLTTFCKQEFEATLTCMALFLPIIIFAGIVNCLEQLDKFYRNIVCAIFPGSLFAEAMRSMVTRGWGLGSSNVWPGFVYTIGAIVFFWALTMFLYKKNWVR